MTVAHDVAELRRELEQATTRAETAEDMVIVAEVALLQLARWCQMERPRERREMRVEVFRAILKSLELWREPAPQRQVIKLATDAEVAMDPRS